MDKQKATLLDAYLRKAIALGKIYLIESSQNNPEVKPPVKELNDISEEVGKFMDCLDNKVS